jgi:plastocyanin
MRNTSERGTKLGLWIGVVSWSLLALAGFLLTGCPSSNGTDQTPASVTVKIENSAFSPLEVTIRVGETVRWTNDDPVYHTVTSGNPDDADAGALFDSDDLIPFDSFTHQFNEAGEFAYFSKWDRGRPGMVGAKVIVTE